MNCLIGVLLALPVMALVSRMRPAVQRWLYPSMVVVVASFYPVFAACSGQLSVVLTEAGIAVGFFALAVLGYGASIWFIVAALAAHGIFDLIHPSTVANSGVPSWWGGFCWTYDLGAAGILVLATWRSRISSQRTARRVGCRKHDRCARSSRAITRQSDAASTVPQLLDLPRPSVLCERRPHQAP